MKSKRLAAAVGLLATTMALAPAVGTASAQEWQPSRPVTLVVPFPAGGGNDALARLVAERMSRTLGQQVVVENRGGAGGTVATRAIVKSPPDGHTILLSYTGTFAINPTLYPNAGYDPRKDFAAIGSIGTLTSVLVSHPSLPVKSTSELIAYGKANPGKSNYGFVPGTVGHISTEMFARSANIKLTNIPYKGNGNAIADLMGGHVSMMFLSILPVIGQIQAGTLNALAVASPARSTLIPNVPTIAESGVPGFSAVISYGLAAPAGTPRPVIERLNKELQAALADPSLRKRLDAEGGTVLPGTADDYAKMIDDEEKKWGPLVRSLNLKVARGLPRGDEGPRLRRRDGEAQYRDRSRERRGYAEDCGQCPGDAEGGDGARQAAAGVAHRFIRRANTPASPLQ